MCVVLTEPVPRDGDLLPQFTPGDSNTEWVSLSGSPVANLSHPEFNTVVLRKRLEDTGSFLDRVITQVTDDEEFWTLNFDVSEFGSADNTVKVDKSLGVVPEIGGTIRIYVDEPELFIHSKQLGVAIGDRALMFDK